MENTPSKFERSVFRYWDTGYYKGKVHSEGVLLADFRAPDHVLIQSEFEFYPRETLLKKVTFYLKQPQSNQWPRAERLH